MTSTVLKGQRCRATTRITSHAGVVDRFSEGQIRYVVENLDRLLVTVDWDTGTSSVLFPHEIEILAPGPS